MLVLTRTSSQSLIIGNGEITLTVLEIRGNQVRVGIDAPKHISVHREEIYRRIQEETKTKKSEIVKQSNKSLP